MVCRTIKKEMLKLVEMNKDRDLSGEDQSA